MTTMPIELPDQIAEDAKGFIVDELEELDDVHAYDQTKASSQEKIPFEQAVREIRLGIGA